VLEAEVINSGSWSGVGAGI